MKDRDKSRQGVAKLLKNEIISFFSESSIPGLRYVAQGHDLVERITWSVFLTFAFCRIYCHDFKTPNLKTVM